MAGGKHIRLALAVPVIALGITVGACQQQEIAQTPLLTEKDPTLVTEAQMQDTIPVVAAKEEKRAPKLQKIEKPAEPVRFKNAKYEAVPYRSGIIDSLIRAHGEDGWITIMKLNRQDRKHIRKGDTLIIPVEMAPEIEFSPFPKEIPALANVPKLMFISQRVQAVAAYENGELVRWMPTNTGKKATQTPTGLKHTNWRSKKRNSTVDNSWVLEWYFNLTNDGVSLHKYDLPGYPASHSCIRLLEHDAKWIYNWADAWILLKTSGKVAEGTPVIIMDKYEFGKPKPWMLVAENPEAGMVTDAEIQAQLDKYLDKIIAEVNQRADYLEKRKLAQAQEAAPNVNENKTPVLEEKGQ
jgi:lipoprotein-anchoring transpeptidase ErfK/SrfK